MSLLGKIFIYTTALFLLLFSFVPNSRSIGFDEEEAKALFSEGIGCGYANTENNQCCETQKGFLENIEEEDLNTAINNLKSCTLTEAQVEENGLISCLSDEEAVIINTLIAVEENSKDRISLIKAIGKYILDQDPKKQTNFIYVPPQIGAALTGGFDIITLENIDNSLRSNKTTYNNLSRDDKFKLWLKNSVAQKEDKCLINLLGGKTLCVLDAVNFGIDSAGNDQSFGAFLEAQNELTQNECIYGTPDPDTQDGSCTCKAETGLSKLCGDYISDTTEYERCAECTENRGGFWTGFGCIGLSFQGFVQETLFGWALGLAGIITLLCIFYAAFMLQTSAGNPERVKKARQYLTACITGLLLIIFSILILRIIGINILQIPGFS